MFKLQDEVDVIIKCGDKGRCVWICHNGECKRGLNKNENFKSVGSDCMNIRQAKIIREKSDEINKDIINKLKREINEFIEKGLNHAYKDGCYEIEIVFEDMDSKHVGAIMPYLNQIINKLIDLGYNASFTTVNNQEEKHLEDLKITIKW